ncbi:g3781 [Coccomyxa viridis]|uniref:G3781 protein n=1 Tax=Coccomyxa viridis TaxID=1274662 RepID=A0ABP1FSL5_9CHLO
MHSGCPHPDADPQDSPVWTSEERSHAGEAAERAKEGLSEGRERAKYTAEEEAAQRAAEMGTGTYWWRQLAPTGFKEASYEKSAGPKLKQAMADRFGSIDNLKHVMLRSPYSSLYAIVWDHMIKQ